MRGKRKEPITDDLAAPGDPAHAPGKRHLAPPDQEPDQDRSDRVKRWHDQPWLPTSGLIGRRRRSARRS